jgi:hypothetical protein
MNEDTNIKKVPLRMTIRDGIKLVQQNNDSLINFMEKAADHADLLYHRIEFLQIALFHFSNELGKSELIIPAERVQKLRDEESKVMWRIDLSPMDDGTFHVAIVKEPREEEE